MKYALLGNAGLLVSRLAFGAMTFTAGNKDIGAIYKVGAKLVERMRASAGKHDASVAQVAIAWLLAKDAVTAVLIGATKPHQLDDNLGAVNVELTEAEIAELDAATPLAPVYLNWFIENLADRPTAQALAKNQA